MSILSNNRFLQRVNPEIARARTDAGASLVSDHAVIQPLMRNMVDLGIIDDLKLWVHSGLVNTRTVGADDFVPKAYDISGEENDAVQATTESQPQLHSDSMDFDGSNDFLNCGNDNSLNTPNNLSVFTWIKSTYAGGDNVQLIGKYRNFPTTGRSWVAIIRNTVLRVFVLSDGDGDSSTAKIYTSSVAINTGSWVHAGFTFSSNSLKVYINGSEDTGVTKVWDGTVNSIHEGSLPVVIGYNNITGTGLAHYYYDGEMNDARIFNTTLSATQITSIYNATKGYYGIT